MLAVAMALLRVLEPTCPLSGQSGPSSSKLEACGGPRSAVREPASPAVEMEATDGQAGEGDKPQEEVKRDSDAREPGKGLVLGSHEHKFKADKMKKMCYVAVFMEVARVPTLQLGGTCPVPSLPSP